MATRGATFLTLAHEILLPRRVCGYDFERRSARDFCSRSELAIQSSSPQTPEIHAHLLDGLPRELLWEITGYLDECDLAAMALTCKRAYHAWFTPNLRMHMRTRCHHVRRLLERLSRDLHTASAANTKRWSYNNNKKKIKLLTYNPETLQLGPCACLRCRTPAQARQQLHAALRTALTEYPVLRAFLKHTNIYSGDVVRKKRKRLPLPFSVDIGDVNGNIIKRCRVDPKPYPEPPLDEISPILAKCLLFVNVLCAVLRHALKVVVRVKMFGIGPLIYCSCLFVLLFSVVLLLLLAALYLMLQVYAALVVSAVVVHIWSGCWQGLTSLF